MFKFVNGSLPPTLKDQFTFVKDIHSFSTRSSCAEDIALPKCRTEFLKHTLCYTGPKLWNSLPLELKTPPLLILLKLTSKISCYRPIINMRLGT